jgi:MFS transporter, ACS family, tartrate transporter
VTRMPVLPGPGANSDAVARRAEVVSRLTRRLLPLLFLLYVVAYVDRINIGFAALQMQSRLGLSSAGYGFAAGVFFAGYVVFQVPSLLALQRIGARRWIALLMIGWGLISSSLIFVRTPWHLYALRFLLGSAEAGFFPGVVFYLKSWFPSTARAKALALFATAGPVSAVITGPLSGTLLGIHRAGLAGWQWMFLLEGAPAVILGAVAFLFLTNNPKEAHWLPLEQRSWLVAELLQEDQEHQLDNRGGIFNVFISLPVWLLVMVYFGVNSAGYGITFWLPSLIRSLSAAGSIEIGLISAIPYAAALIVMILAGAHSDKSGEHRWHIAVPAFLGALALISAAHSTSVIALIAALSVAVVAGFSISGPFWALSATVEPKQAAASIALINALGNLGGLCGSYAIGALKSSDAGFRNGIEAVGIALGVAGGLVLLVRLRTRGVGHEQATTGALVSRSSKNKRRRDTF